MDDFLSFNMAPSLKEVGGIKILNLGGGVFIWNVGWGNPGGRITFGVFREAYIDVCRTLLVMVLSPSLFF